MAETSVNTATSLTRPMRTTSAVIAAISWFALVLQLLLMVQQAAPGTSFARSRQLLQLFYHPDQPAGGSRHYASVAGVTFCSRTIFSSTLQPDSDRGLHHHRRRYLQLAAPPIVESARRAEGCRRPAARRRPRPLRRLLGFPCSEIHASLERRRPLARISRRSTWPISWHADLSPTGTRITSSMSIP